MEDTKTAEKKKASWEKIGKLATITFPSGLKHTFDVTKLSTHADVDPFAFYGTKQWLSDQGASAKDTPEKDRLQLMIDAYKEATEKGVVLSEGGKVQVVGKERKNAAPRTQDTAVEAKYTTMTLAEVESLLAVVSLGLVKISPELGAKLELRKLELTSEVKGKKK